MVDQFEPR